MTTRPDLLGRREHLAYGPVSLCQGAKSITDTLNGHGPVLPDCKPLACRNVALTPANLTAWRQQLARLDQTLGCADVLAPYLRHRLAEQRDQIARFLDETADTSEGSA